MALTMRFLRLLPKSATLPAMAPTLHRLSPHPKVGVVKFWGHVRAASSGGSVVEQRITDFAAESISEGTLQTWKKKVGDFVQKDEVIAIIETDKVVVDIVAIESGIVKELHAKEDDNVELNQLLLSIEVGTQIQPSNAESPMQASPADKATTTVPVPSEPVAPAAVPTPAVAAPGLRAAFARLAAVRLGTTPVATAGPQPSATPASQPVTKSTVRPVINEGAGTGRTERRIPISDMRKRVHMRLKETQNTAALLTTFQEVDMSAFQELRSKYKDLFEKTHGFPFDGLSFLVKASSKTLQENAAVNAVIDDSSKEIVYRDNVDISVPIPSPRGPISCVIHGAQSMSIHDIGAQIATFKTNARQDKLSIDNLGASTFGITDTSMAGGMMGTGIINPPQSAVLATHATKQRATVIGGKVVARPIMYMAFTYDHRLIDGREAVSFLCSVRDKLEDPARMLLDL